MSQTRDRTVTVRPPRVSFAAADQRWLLCPGCWRLFRTVNTSQTHCSLRCTDKDRTP